MQLLEPWPTFVKGVLGKLRRQQHSHWVFDPWELVSFAITVQMVNRYFG
jgi:hypothetical protein